MEELIPNAPLRIQHAAAAPATSQTASGRTDEKGLKMQRITPQFEATRGGLARVSVRCRSWAQLGTTAKLQHPRRTEWAGLTVPADFVPRPLPSFNGMHTCQPAGYGPAFSVLPFHRQSFESGVNST